VTVDQFEKIYGKNPALGKPVHKHYCKRCPSHPSKPLDEEAKDFARLPIELRRLVIFPCAWRPEKICRGIHELMERGL
jgi:hypothetical protein